MYISRKKFLENSALYVGGAMFSSLTTRGREYVADNTPLRLALVGCGGRGTGATAQALRTEGSVELVAMADVFRDQLDNSYQTLQKVEDIKEYVKVPEAQKYLGFEAYKKAINAADVVILATPPGFRPFHFEKAIEAGKHVFMEKPLASDAPGIRKILEAGKIAENKGLSVVVGLQNRYDIGYKKLIKKVKNGAIGRILSAKCNYLKGGYKIDPRQPEQTEVEFQIRNYHYFDWLWAGAPAGLNIHYTDLVHWAKGSYPQRAQGVGGRAGSDDCGDTYDTFYIEYEYKDGTKLHSEIRFIDGCWLDTGMQLQGSEGSASMQKGIKDLKGNTLWTSPVNTPNKYQVEQDKFFASIREGSPINDTEWGAKSTMASIMGRMAAQSGHRIEWEEALSSDVVLVPENLTYNSEAPVLPTEDGDYSIPVPGSKRGVV